MLNSIQNKEYTYEWIIERKKSINNYTLPEESLNILKEIKQKLHIYNFKPKQNNEKNKSNINKIYDILNKITEKTYDKLSEELMIIINNIIEDENNNNIIQEICEKIFLIITNNSLCCDVYAKLYNKLVKTHDIFKDIFTKNTKKYLEDFKNIEYVSSSKDYDKYCLYVKYIEKMKNFTLFLIKCVFYRISKLDDIVDILIYFQERLIKTFENEEHIYENEQTIDALELIFKHTIEFLMFHEKWDIIEKNINYLHEFKGPGKNNKIKFKIMDILDIIKKNNE